MPNFILFILCGECRISEMKRSEIELNVTHKSDKKEFKTMKKKIVIALVTIILLILASNIVIHTHLNKSLFQFFFSNNENQESIVKKY